MGWNIFTKDQGAAADREMEIERMTLHKEVRETEKLALTLSRLVNGLGPRDLRLQKGLHAIERGLATLAWETVHSVHGQLQQHRASLRVLLRVEHLRQRRALLELQLLLLDVQLLLLGQGEGLLGLSERDIASMKVDGKPSEGQGASRLSNRGTPKSDGKPVDSAQHVQAIHVNDRPSSPSDGQP